MKNQRFPWLRRRAAGLSRSGHLIMMGGGITLFCLLLLLLSQPARAQYDPTRPVDTSAFPDLTVRIPCTDALPLSALTFVLREDEVTRPLHKELTVDAVYLKTQTFFLLDLIQGSEALRGPIGDTLTRFFTYYSATVPANAYSQFTFAAFAPAGDGETLAVIKPPTRELGSLVTSIYQLDLHAPQQTGLITLVVNSLAAFDKSVPERRTLVVFSDGTDPTQSKDAIAAMKKKFLDQSRNDGIRIDTIFIKTTPGDLKMLEEIATTTGGTHVETLGNTTAVDRLLQKLVAPQAICTLAYRTNQPHPRRVTVQTVLSDVIVATTTLPIPQVKVSPPVVELDARLLVADIILGQMPVTAALSLDLRWGFDDYPGREIDNITVNFIGVNQDLPQPPPIRRPTGQPLSLAIPVNELGPGNFSLEVVVRDELGLEERDIAPFRIVAPTPIPTATPTPTVTPISTATPTPTPTTVLSRLEGELSKVDANYSRIFLLAPSLLLILGLGGISYWLTSALLKLRSERAKGSALPFLISRAQPAPAVLYRLQTHPELPLRQVLKLGNTVNLPEDLILDAKPSMRARHLEKVRQSIATQAQIERKGQTEFYLGYSPGAIQGSLTVIQFERNGVVESVAREARPTLLKHNDILYLSPVVCYRFIDLTRSPAESVDDNSLPNSAVSGRS